MRIRGVICFILFLSSLLFAEMPKQSKEILKNRYLASKFSFTRRDISKLGVILVIKKPDICAAAVEHPNSYGLEGMDLQLHPEIVEIENGSIQQTKNCNVTLEPGQLVVIFNVGFYKDFVSLSCKTLEPVAVTRGIGAFKDKYVENVSTAILFHFPPSWIDSGDTDTIIKAIEQWVQPFDSYEKAKAFSIAMKDENARKGIPEINAGMSIADVEKIMGLPEKKANIGNKVIYKYKDMTVEFIDGKVTDVKF